MQSDMAIRGTLGTIKIPVQALLTSIGLLFLFACHKPVAQVPASPSPAGSASQQPNIAYFAAEPQVITAGQSSSLRWSTGNATHVEITPEIGAVQTSDRRDISPAETTTYTLKASNAAASVEASVTVTVSRPPPPARTNTEDTGISVTNGELKDVHFDYDEAKLKEDDHAILDADADLLLNLFRLDANAHVTIEGHCDDRGSDEFNLALGDRRATAVKEALVRLGVPTEKLDVISYGKERPLCLMSDEACYAKNRRAHFTASHTRTRTASLPQ